MAYTEQDPNTGLWAVKSAGVAKKRVLGQILEKGFTTEAEAIKARDRLEKEFMKGITTSPEAGIIAPPPKLHPIVKEWAGKEAEAYKGYRAKPTEGARQEVLGLRGKREEAQKYVKDFPAMLEVLKGRISGAPPKIPPKQGLSSLIAESVRPRGGIEPAYGLTEVGTVKEPTPRQPQTIATAWKKAKPLERLAMILGGVGSMAVMGKYPEIATDLRAQMERGRAERQAAGLLKGERTWEKEKAEIEAGEKSKTERARIATELATGGTLGIKEAMTGAETIQKGEIPEEEVPTGKPLLSLESVQNKLLELKGKVKKMPVPAQNQQVWTEGLERLTPEQAVVKRELVKQTYLGKALIAGGCTEKELSGLSVKEQNRRKIEAQKEADKLFGDWEKKEDKRVERKERIESEIRRLEREDKHYADVMILQLAHLKTARDNYDLSVKTFRRTGEKMDKDAALALDKAKKEEKKLAKDSIKERIKNLTQSQNDLLVLEGVEFVKELSPTSQKKLNEWQARKDGLRENLDALEKGEAKPKSKWIE